MFQRKIQKELLEWKESLAIKKKALVVKGLRQVGKTTTLMHFAQSNFKHVIAIDFKKEPRWKSIFAGNLDVNTLVMNLSAAFPSARFIPGETVLFFDEIQECSGARSSIKYFMEDGRFDVIASGSLLGIRGYNEKYHGGIPVGFEHTLYMKPMDFEEFLMARGLPESLLAYLKQCFLEKTPITNSIHENLLRYYKEYICVGGMPAVVDVFLKTKDFNAVHREQKDLLESFRDDFGKHLDENEREKTDLALLGRVNKVFDSIPAQLAKENKKFMYSHLEKGASASLFSPAIQWLSDYGLVSYCYNLRLLESPLSGNKRDDVFKLYMNDTGLFIAMLDTSTPAKILLGDMNIYKGAIYENIVADAFVKTNRPLYYYSKDSGLEIDFITEIKGKISLIEVKATTGNTKSAKTILQDEAHYPEVSNLIKFTANNIDSYGKVTNYPYYLSYLL